MKTRTCPHCQHALPQGNLRFCPVCGLSLQPATTFPDYSYQPLETAPLVSRFLARMIDYIIITILTQLGDRLSDGMLFQSVEWWEYGVEDLPQTPLVLAIFLLLWIGYFVVFHSAAGQTPGKWLCRIIVLNRQRKPLYVWQSLLRELGWVLTLLTGGVLLLKLLFHSERRGFHDMLSQANVYALGHP